MAGALAFAVFVVLAGATAYTRYPWINEAWFASPALNLETRGYMGTCCLEGKGTWLEGIDRYTYWIMPLHVLIQAVWYKIAGFGVLSLRSLSVVAGCAVLGAWLRFIGVVTRDRSLAVWAVCLLAIDYRFVVWSALGRMDMLCAALGLSAIATYVSMREEAWEAAVWRSHALAAAAVMTHPCGILYTAALLVLTTTLDRHALRPAVAARVAAPYVAAFSLWGVYIARAPEVFARQFFGNVSGFAGEMGASRTTALLHPLRAIKQEIASRYLWNFGSTAAWNDPKKLQYLVLGIYVIAMLEAIASGRFRQDGYRLIALVGLTMQGLLFAMDGLHEVPYIVHVLPFLVFFAAVMLRDLTAKMPKGMAWPVLATCAALQLAPILNDAKQDSYHNEFVPAVTFLRQHWVPGTTLIGASQLGFEIGFAPFLHDDVRLGYFTGVRPDYIVTDRLYEDWFEGARGKNPEVYKHIRTTLDSSVVVFRNRLFTIYRPQESAHR